ncbi:MAG: rod-binding protein [Bacteriovoracaceae bacterium]|nr:rod-binding protein [Bacteriovoracaceae bacterium]
MANNITKSSFLNLQKPAVQKTDDKYIPKAYTDVASGMEKMFANMMIEQMNKTAGKVTADSPSSQFYKSLQSNQRADAMASQNGGMGVQRMILDQIYPKEMRTEANLNMHLSREKARMPHKKAVELYRQKFEQQEIRIRPEQEVSGGRVGISKYHKEDTNE